MIERGESDAMRMTSNRDARSPLRTSAGAIAVYFKPY